MDSSTSWSCERQCHAHKKGCCAINCRFALPSLLSKRAPKRFTQNCVGRCRQSTPGHQSQSPFGWQVTIQNKTLLHTVIQLPESIADKLVQRSGEEGIFACQLGAPRTDKRIEWFPRHGKESDEAVPQAPFCNCSSAKKKVSNIGKADLVILAFLFGRSWHCKNASWFQPLVQCHRFSEGLAPRRDTSVLTGQGAWRTDLVILNDSSRCQASVLVDQSQSPARGFANASCLGILRASWHTHSSKEV